MFKDRKCIEDEEFSGRNSPFISTDEQHVQEINNLVLSNCRLTIRNIVELIGISFGSCQSILRNNLDLRLLLHFVLFKNSLSSWKKFVIFFIKHSRNIHKLHIHLI